MTPRELLSTLSDIEKRSRERALALPDAEVRQETWQGLTYTVGGVRVVSAMAEIRELLTYPESVTKIPGAKPWMTGLANIRGVLLPVVDLQMFLGGKPIVPGRSTRLLVVSRRGVEAGLVVSSVTGMRYFTEDQRMDNARLDGSVGAYVYSAFSAEGEIWPVFSMSALCADAGYRVAAA